ncbi:putative glycerol-3-phosphate dehydrogenase (NAD(+)) [Helianthus annuus]|nr:putative glycerol-3-phosphate dehydrogenase (NAD(+)) [Helianthus annuus]
MAPVNNNDEHPPKFKVTIVGSGNWGSMKSRCGVFEEMLPGGEKLTDAINRTNENVKYLPGIKLGHNVVADPDLENAGIIIIC